MKILMICGFYPSKTALTEGVFFHNQVKALKKLGQEGTDVDVDVLLLDLRSVRKKRLLGYSEYKYDSVSVKRYSLPCGPVPGLSFFTRIASNRGFSRYIEKYGKPDIIHTHFFSISKEGCMLKRRYHIPLVMTEHGSGVAKVKGAKKGLEYRRVYDCADYLIAVGNALKRKMNEFTDREIDMIPNIIPQYFFDAKIENNSSKKDKRLFRIISVGSLIRCKRFDLTIRAFRRFHDTCPQSELLIVGKGPLEHDLRDLAENLQISRNVVFLGQIENKKLPEYYAASNCFVLPSDSETFGVVYAEAAAVGIPIIATKCGGPEDIVTENNGLLVPLDDVDALYGAMKLMHERQKEYDSSVISKGIEEKYSERVVAQELLRVYTEVLDRGMVL